MRDRTTSRRRRIRNPRCLYCRRRHAAAELTIHCGRTIGNRPDLAETVLRAGHGRLFTNLPEAAADATSEDVRLGVVLIDHGSYEQAVFVV